MIHQTFQFWQALGVHVTPNHFYEPIPDTSRLPERLWTTPSDLAGLELNDAGQVALLAHFVERYRAEYSAFPASPTGNPSDYFADNGMFLGVDAEMLYCLVREHKPARIVEIGSGFSTRVSAAAIRRNREDDPSYRGELIALDPFPPPELRAGFAGLTRLIEQPVQNVPIEEFTSLTAGDILFIDSSHVLKIGSDVQHEYLSILPRLQPGVLVHVHDIFLPMEYPREWVIDRHRFWNEQYLLQAFLAFNTSFEIIWAGSYMHRYHPDLLQAAFSTYHPDERWQGRAWLPGSFWFRRIR